MSTTNMHGFQLEEEGGEIIAITSANGRGRQIHLGNAIVANGKFAAPRGTRGIVMGLYRPHCDHLTTNVIEVHWEADPPSRKMMKFKHLAPPQ